MDITRTLSGASASMGNGSSKMVQSDNVSGLERSEPGIVANARSRSNEASQPEGGKVIASKEEKK